ncbi:MAG: hypothetical protein HY262_00570 [Chloroflexi bacterium]|nr:hypothetical protein [Chloroflexota bacterium]
MGRSNGLRVVRHLIFGAAFASASGLPAVPVAAASTPPIAHAVLDGRPLALADVYRYHCHDRSYPLIRCFLDPAQRDLDELAAASAAELSTSVSPYVRWYADRDLLGASFDATNPYSNLGDVGWNDKISSFSPYPGGHPRWSQDIGYGGTRWDWGTAPVSYVGDAANDRFSSVERL